jgi:hypothetical protein
LATKNTTLAMINMLLTAMGGCNTGLSRNEIQSTPDSKNGQYQTTHQMQACCAQCQGIALGLKHLNYFR